MVGYAAGMVLVTGDIASTSTLDHLKLVDVALGVWVPRRSCVFYNRPDISCVCCLLDLLIAVPESQV